MILLGWLGLSYRSQSLALSFGSLLLILLGAALLTPVATRLLMKLLHPLTGSSLGIVGIMAPRDITRSLSRTSVTIAALMLAVTVIIGVSIMIDSFRNTVVNWLDQVLAADIYVSPAGQTSRVDGEIAPDFIATIEKMEEVSLISMLRGTTTFSPEFGQVEIRAISPQPGEQRRPMLWSIGNTDEVLAALDQGGVLVTEVFARRNKLPLDRPSNLVLTTDQGPREFQVGGIFYDYAAPELGYVLMRLNTYRNFWQDKSISNIGLFLKPGLTAQTDGITQRLEYQFAGQYALTFDSNRSIKENALEIFDRTFTITAALRLLATVVAFIGVLSTLMALQLERTRELGTLRANGMSRFQLWGKTLLETALMGLTAGLMSMPLGLVLAIILIYVINLRSFGWSLQLHLNPGIFLMALVVAMVAALLAGIYPVLRLNKMEIATALREE
jgi:putative ABC transport system permease protein